jgi:hypothetical protein
MSDGRSSPELRTMLEAARADGPSAASRTKVWGTIASTVGTVGATGAPAALGFGGLSAAKALIAGTLLGGGITVGLATAALTLRPLPVVDPPSAFEPRADVPVLLSESTANTVLRAAAMEPTTGVTESTGGNSAVGTTDRVGVSPEASEARASAAWSGTANDRYEAAPPVAHAHGGRVLHRNTAPPAGVAPTATSRGSAVAPDDDLGREAWLLADARAALARGDAAGALRSVRATLGIRSRQLVPEELALEAQALRALGRSDDAAGVEARLRARFPDSALVR